MPNRSLPPTIAPMERIPFPKHRELILPNRIPLIQLQSDNYDVVKVEFVFNAGRVFELKKLVSRATNMLLKSGTPSLSSFEIHEKIDFHGATISLPINFDHSGIVLYCLSKHAKNLIPLLIDIIANPTFPEDELEQFKEQQKSKLKIALENVDTLAFRHITESIFGAQHPYGYNSDLVDYDLLHQDDLIWHHRQQYIADNCRIFVSGNLSDHDLQLMSDLIMEIPQNPKAPIPNPMVISSGAKEIYIPIPDKVQSAIRIGRKMFNRKNADYQNFYLLNVILGGYFGSRLSMKIREEKGYSYGIHSSLESMVHDGYFMISTEVDKKYKDATLEAIYDELEDLRSNEVSKEELEQMKSYLQGYLLNSVDGVFRSSSLLRGLRESGVDARYFESLQEAISNIEPVDLKRMAQKYLQRKDLWQVVVG